MGSKEARIDDHLINPVKLVMLEKMFAEMPTFMGTGWVLNA